MDWLHHMVKVWHWGVAALTLVLSVFASGHALLYRRKPQSAALWVAIIWIVPLLGALLYFLFGINRIKRRAILLRGDLTRFRAPPTVPDCTLNTLAGVLSADHRHLVTLAATTAKVQERPLLPGNCVDMLEDGDAAYPAMLEAIAGARHSITLSTYIFDRDEAGLAFARALGAAVKRGVEVRVLIDATGMRYSWPSILGVLRKEGVPCGRFLRSFPLRRVLEMNLRLHRKILVVDGRTGFTGGMNVRLGHWLEKKPRSPVRDLHFRIVGPVVAQLQEAFVDDWFFTTAEALRGEKWFPPIQVCGSVVARGIADGPDEDFEKLRWTLMAALTAAKHSVRIATPYFLPESTLIAALNLTALRGVAVDILVPARSNLPVVQWAATAQYWQVLERGCRIWVSPPPFDHSKLFVVDDCWSLVGSTNWDPRSLRLNFEYNVECYDSALAGTLSAWFDKRVSEARQLTLAEVDARNLPVRLRDGAARLFTPFL